MRAIALSGIAIALVSLAAEASAECGHFAMTETTSSYVLQDVPAVAWDGGAQQGAYSYTCGPWSFNAWGSVALDAPGSFGDRGYGDEIDLGGAWADQIAGVNVSVSADYFVLADFGDFGDDMVQIAAEASVPLSVGGIEIAPYGRAFEWLGTGDFDDATLLRPGVRINIPLPGDFSLGADVAQTFNLTEGTDHSRASGRLSYGFGNGVNLYLQGKFTEGLPAAYSFGVARSW